jgi:two-component system C4-dicarboxylate transport sensor histidine kinase DctB
MPDSYSARSFLPYRPVVVIVTLTLFVLTLIYSTLATREQAMSELEQKVSDDLVRYKATLEQRLERYRSLPQLLANHRLLLDAVSGAGEDTIASANLYLQEAAELVNALDIYVMDSAGTTQAASNWFKDTSFIGRNFAFRPYFTDAMQGVPGRYFALGSTTKKRGYYFSFPMRRAQQVIGAVVVKIDLDQIEGRWSDPNTEVVVSDDDGVVVISTNNQWMFKTLSPLNSEQMQRIVDSLRYGDQALNSLNIVYRERAALGTEVITLLEPKDPTQNATDQLNPNQYLTNSADVEDTDLKIHIFANLRPVEERILLVQLLATIGFVVIALVSILLFQRRRIRSERELFSRREAQVRREQEERIEGVINHTQAGLSLIDSDGRIEYFNPILEQMFGYTPEQMLGQPFYNLVSEADRPVLQQYITREISTREANLRLEVDGIRVDSSEFPVELALSYMERGGRTQLILTLVDITERRQHIEALERAQNELELRVEERTVDLQAANEQLLAEVEKHHQTQNELVQAAKLATIGQMSAGINHELNQPLTAIRNYADNADKFLEMDRKERVHQNLLEIASLTERMARIIHPLKEFSRKSDDIQGRVSLRDLKDGAMSILYGQLDRQGVTIRWPDNLEQLWVKGDLLRLEQVMVNIINNAAQALEQSERKEIEIKVSQDQQRLIISVIDTGPGLDAESLANVFTPFFTTKLQGQGLGLGLSISQRIVSSLGGELSAHNHPAGGAEFRIELEQG